MRSRKSSTGYAREAGVRSLENYIKKILRKVAVKVVRELEHKKDRENIENMTFLKPT